MNAIFSIRKPYTDLILNGRKTLEFRNRIGQNIGKGDWIYLYESKANGGAGRVVGKARIKSILSIPKLKIGTYFLLPYYAELFASDEEKQNIQKAMQIRLNSHNVSLVCDYLMDEESLDEMLITNEPPNTFWRIIEDVQTFDELRQKTMSLCDKVDAWGREIGYYNTWDESSWEYAVLLEKPLRFSKPFPITSFIKRDGELFITAPQSWAYTTGRR